MNAPLKFAGACGIAFVLGLVTLPAADEAAADLYAVLFDGRKPVRRRPRRRAMFG